MAKRIHSVSVSAPVISNPPIATAKSTSGVTSPSLSPDSTLIACRMRTGTDRSLTTAWPRPASVGASRTATRNAVTRPMAGSTTRPTTTPNTMVRGRPISRSRAGTFAEPRMDRRSIRAASVKRHRTSATSPISRRPSIVRCGRTASVVTMPTRMPTATATIWGEMLHAPRDREMSA
jgi:hypothetical protein